MARSATRRRPRTPSASSSSGRDPVARCVRPRAPGAKTERYRLRLFPDGGVACERARPTQWPGSQVNTELRPRFPGPWVDEHGCKVCGETPDERSFGVTWADGEALVREVNGTRGGYRPRGPVLWAMKVVKLNRFGEAHMTCGSYAIRSLKGPLRDPLPPDMVWLCLHGPGDCTHLDRLLDYPTLTDEAWTAWTRRRRRWSAAMRATLRRDPAKRASAWPLPDHLPF